MTPWQHRTFAWRWTLTGLVALLAADHAALRWPDEPTGLGGLYIVAALVCFFQGGRHRNHARRAE